MVKLYNIFDIGDNEYGLEAAIFNDMLSSSLEEARAFESDEQHIFEKSL